jgi:hypothetical protein
MSKVIFEEGVIEIRHGWNKKTGRPIVPVYLFTCLLVDLSIL